MKKIVLVLFCILGLKAWAQETQPAVSSGKEVVFMVVEQMPEFPGGQEALFHFLSENVKYPVIAQENGIQGRVIVQFVVNTDGSIVDVEVIRSGGDASLDKEAVRVIESMPKWKPGKHKGEPVRVKYTTPINFSLTNNNSQLTKTSKNNSTSNAKICSRTIVLSKAGTLSSLTQPEDYDTLTHLIIAGPINSSDMYIIRHLCGARDCLLNNDSLIPLIGRVNNLDLRKAVIMNDKSFFYEHRSMRQFWGSRTTTTSDKNGRVISSKTFSWNYDLSKPISKSDWRCFHAETNDVGIGCKLTWTERPNDDKGDVYEHSYCVKNKISNFMFNRCSSLRQITLPEKVKYIGDYAFDNNSIIEIFCPQPINKYVIDKKNFFIKRLQYSPSNAKKK